MFNARPQRLMGNHRRSPHPHQNRQLILNTTFRVEARPPTFKGAARPFRPRWSSWAQVHTGSWTGDDHVRSRSRARGSAGQRRPVTSPLETEQPGYSGCSWWNSSISVSLGTVILDVYLYTVCTAQYTEPSIHKYTKLPLLELGEACTCVFPLQYFYTVLLLIGSATHPASAGRGARSKPSSTGPSSVGEEAGAGTGSVRRLRVLDTDARVSRLQMFFIQMWISPAPRCWLPGADSENPTGSSARHRLLRFGSVLPRFNRTGQVRARF